MAEYSQLTDSPEEHEEEHHFNCKVATFLGLVVAMLVLGVSEGARILDALNQFVQWCGTLGWIAAVLISLGIAVVTLAGVPSCALFVGSGVIFEKMYGMAVGTAVGCTSACSGVWMGSVSAFVLGRTILKPIVEKKLNEIETMRIVNMIIEKEGWKFAFLMRLSPFMPAEVFNYACSVTSMSFSANCLACVGSLPTTAFWVWTSASATNAATSTAEDASRGGRVWLFIGVNAVVIFLMVILVRSATKKYNAYVHAIEEEDHKKHLQSGSVDNRLRRASTVVAIARTSGAVHTSNWIAAKAKSSGCLSPASRSR